MSIKEKDEIEVIMLRGRNLPDAGITEILDELQKEQPSIYRFIYGETSDVIGILNRDMANLYLDLSFDVVWFFRAKFGKPPIVADHESWTTNKLALLDAELKSLTNEIPMDDKFRSKLQERFVKRSLDTFIQMDLLKYLETQVEHFASFEKKREKAIEFTMNLLFVLVRLFGDLYALKHPIKEK